MNTKTRNIILYLIFLFSTTFIVTEIVFRLFDPFGVAYLYEIERYVKTFKKDADFLYINQPGFSGEVQGVSITINSEGLRSPQIDFKNKTKKRILILGDSIVFGWGVEQDSIFIYRLFDRFKEKIEIIGAGTNSWNTKAEYEYLKKHGLAFKPDYLVLIINPNDIYLYNKNVSEKNISFKNSIRLLSEKLASYSYATSTLLAFYQKYRHAKIMSDMFENTPQAIISARNATVSMIDLCKNSNIEILPIIFGNQDIKLVKQTKLFYGNIFNEYDIHVESISNPGLFSRKYTNSAIDGHPNSAGHKIISDFLAELIKPLKLETTLK